MSEPTNPPPVVPTTASLGSTSARYFGPDGAEIGPKDGYTDMAFRLASDAVSRCFTDGAEVEPSRSREFYNEIAHRVLVAVRLVPVQDWAGCRERLAEVAAERDQARFNHATTLLNLDLAEAGRDALQDQILVLQGQAGDMAKEIERLRETIEELLDEREAFGVTGDG